MARKLSPWCKSAKIAMIQQDISIIDLADKFNLTRSYVTSILNGRVTSPIAVKKISDYLHIPDVGAELQV